MASDPLLSPASSTSRADASGGTIPAHAAPAAGEVDRPYRKLPGRMATFLVGIHGFRGLYLGDDHLLQVETIFHVQHYRRFAYADIQSILVRQTSYSSVLSIILGIFAGLGGLLAWGSSDLGRLNGGAIFWLAVAGFFALLLVINVARGKTCHCQLQTAVGLHPLLSLHRLRAARRALALLVERIEAVQGVLTPGEAAARMDEQLARQK